jgi:hypothetical protein
LLLGISSNSCSTTARASINELVESSAAQRRALAQGAGEQRAAGTGADEGSFAKKPSQSRKLHGHRGVRVAASGSKATTEQPLPLDRTAFAVTYRLAG